MCLTGCMVVLALPGLKVTSLEAQLKKWRSAGQQSGNVAAASVPMSEARILESNEKITTMMAREIKKQMKWQVSHIDTLLLPFNTPTCLLYPAIM